MSNKSNNTDQQSGENHGNPAGQGQSNADFKPVNLESEDALHDMLRAKYTEGEDEPASDLKSHPNRNLNKPKIDKPPYS